MKTIRSISFVLVVLVALTGTARVEAAEEVKNLILVGWDGAGLRNIQILLDQGKLPNLKKFITSGGGHLCPIEVVERTDTFSSWTQVLTGIGFDFTGVTGLIAPSQFPCEKFYSSNPIPMACDAKCLYMSHTAWVSHVPRDWSIHYRIKQEGYFTAYFVSKTFLFNYYAVNPLADIVSGFDAKAYHAPNFSVDLRIDNYVDQITDKVINIMNLQKKFFIFAHYNQDEYGHKHGENGWRYLYEFVRADEQLGKILANRNPENTKIIVTTDHGFNENAYLHPFAPDGWLASDLPIHHLYWQQEDQRAIGTLRDIAPTILDWYGIDYRLPLPGVPPIRGKSLLE